jgi:hypothetical protein
VQIKLITRALTPQQMAELFFNINQEVLQIDITEDQKETKTSSERLRAVLYRLREQQ